ncbi:serine/threonine protein kinase [Loa loa]|uniref:Serine/threonine protein kinase n=1 Tax=Loa loa TaxID=7209 RepID=A0A1S0UIH3_LOALO|nr:serine/threonine protein kinase [Loa loa]EJD75333.1 serine/threonine protein kinase [Loa loa]
MGRLQREYDDLEEIGRGGFGVVYRARCIAEGKEWSGKNVAIKKIDITRATMFRVELELEALSRLIHDNIVKFYDQFQEDDAQYIIMEYCKHRSLRDYVKQNGRLSDFSAAYILRQLVSAVKHIHERNMIHRDLSAGNVLISSIREDKLLVKLADFGLATRFRKGDIARTMLGTPGYIAPQVYNRHYNQKADVYSLGGILYLMLTGSDPPRDREVNPFKEKISLEGATLIQSMMDPNEERRISLGDVSMSEFMRKVDGLSLPISRSRETSRERIIYRDCQAAHISPVIVRAHSARPTTSGYKRITKDSAFESGESSHPFRRRPSLNCYRDESAGVENCRHSTYLENQCAHCGKRQSFERKYGRETDDRNGMRHLSRAERRPAFNTNLKQMKESFGDHSNKTTAELIWPVEVSRLAPSEIVRKAGKFTLQKNGTIIYEATIRDRSRSVNRNGSINDEMLVKWIATVKKHRMERRIFPFFTNQINVLLLLQIRNLKQLQRTVDKVDEIALALYKRILNEISAVGGRVVKIIFKPSSDSTARLMENGDFRVKFQDGRLAILKKNANSIVVTTNNKAPASLSNEERCMFECAHTDALLLETFLEGAPFKTMQSFPFHFSNSSQFIMNEVIEMPKEKNLTEQQTKHMISERFSAPTQRALNANSIDKNYQSTDYVPRQSRVPLRTRNISSSSRNSSNDVEIIQKTRQTNCSSPENLQLPRRRPRMLSDGEYILRGQFNKSGIQIPTRIILSNPQNALELRISSNDPKIFVFKEDGHEERFRFDGCNYGCVPVAARDLLFTLCQKRQKLKTSLNYA